MKTWNSILTFGLLLSLLSCSFGERVEEEIINGYYVGWSDLESNRSIYIKDSLNPQFAQTIISNYVYSIGFDSRFILVKTISNLQKEGIKSYYILDTEGHYYSNTDNNNLQVFRDIEKFNEAVKKFGLEKISFDKNYTLSPL